MDSKLKPAGKMTLTYDGKTTDLPVFSGTHGPNVVDFRRFYTDTGLFTFDPGFNSRARGRRGRRGRARGRGKSAGNRRHSGRAVR